MRKTKNEILRLQHEGFYRDIDLGDPVNSFDDVEKKIAEKMGFQATTDDRYKLLEIQVNLDIEGFEDKDEDDNVTGIALPYIVTVEKGTQKVLAIRRNWRPEDETKQKRQHFVHYGYVPGFGFYCFGLIHLVGAFAKSGTSIIRQLVDAGTLSNLPGGFKTRGLRFKGDDTPIAPGEFRDVDVPSGTMRDNLMPLPYKEPYTSCMEMNYDEFIKIMRYCYNNNFYKWKPNVVFDCFVKEVWKEKQVWVMKMDMKIGNALLVTVVIVNHVKRIGRLLTNVNKKISQV
jgi:hypothetical protein